MNNVYKLSHDYNHSGDSEIDAKVIEFEGSSKLPYYLIDVKTYSLNVLPSRIYCQANLSLIPDYDYPLTDMEIPIMSLKMLEILESVNTFDYYRIPVIMLNDTCLDLIPEGIDRIPQIDSFFSIRLNEINDGFFDYEKSDFKMSRRLEGQIGRIKKIVLKRPDHGFPTLFRISETPSTLFISYEAKEALEAANIKGCVYEEVEVSE